ncbi:hippurate hydrolase [Neorhodopirellula lusitana]|uniref:Hippurate hydrolase n=1 Tax=Neorhodopirellula lusitana TaxID=445327 RepID=A0ABY1PS39_9BACT|nr:hippurate hydrolase [Neorhodopirellula lusitana]
MHGAWADARMMTDCVCQTLLTQGRLVRSLTSKSKFVFTWVVYGLVVAWVTFPSTGLRFRSEAGQILADSPASVSKEKETSKEAQPASETQATAGRSSSVESQASAESSSTESDSSTEKGVSRKKRTHTCDIWLSEKMDEALQLYMWLHANPEISFEEKNTAAKLASIWKKAGLEMTTEVGGHGIVGVFRNGEGPTVMLRTDLDALPVTEETPLAFASKQTTTAPDGSTTGVMHACGHDIHMTSLTTVVKYLMSHQDCWSGTLMVIGQPAEERGAGAKAMLEDGLFKRFPKPDYALAAHVSGDTPVGQVGLRAGFSLANVDSVDITMKGRGGHGSQPHNTTDPIVQAAQLVMSLQMIVAREVAPIEPAVVTVGSIHGGTKHNIIGNDCKLQLTVRSYDQGVRQQVLSAIRRRTLAVAQSYDAPEPEIVISEGTPSLKNDTELTVRIRRVLGKRLGAENIVDDEPSMGGEDFSRYGIAGVPILMYRVGTVQGARLERFEKLGVPPPSLHSSRYYPDAEPTLEVAFRAMVAAVLELMPPRR